MTIKLALAFCGAALLIPSAFAQQTPAHPAKNILIMIDIKIFLIGVISCDFFS